MWAYLVGRLAISVPTLFFVTVIVFTLQHLLPGDPALALAGEDRSPETIAAIRQAYKLDQPVPAQYLHWISGVLRGDLGESMRIHKPVTELIIEKLPVTLELAVLAMLIALAIGIPAGVISAVWKGRAVDYIANIVGLAGTAPHIYPRALQLCMRKPIVISKCWWWITTAPMNRCACWAHATPQCG